MNPVRHLIRKESLDSYSKIALNSIGALIEFRLHLPQRLNFREVVTG
jgi:hypothetical protein